ncbi:MAG TPA: hypothetical protein VFQ53_17115 [Kofleriaceae bacterium]|nr:hypothetical protein [Kofleriaceae bacterium]
MVRLRLLAILAVAGACGGTKRDECADATAKLAPVLQRMRDDGATTRALDAIAADVCKPDAAELRRCIHDAANDAVVAGCVEAVLARTQRDRLQQKLDAIDRKLDRLQDDLARPPPAPPVDAAVVGPAPAPLPPPPSPIDPKTLDVLPVPSAGRPGPETELYAVDAPAGQLVLLLAKPPLLARSNAVKITGRLVASQGDVLAAIGSLATLDLAPPKLHGSGPTVDLAFTAAPQRDLFTLLGDVLRVNIVVAPGDLPDVDLVVKRVPAGAVLDALVRFDDRVALRSSNTIYVVPKGSKLPPLRPVPGHDKISLRMRDGNARVATHAIAAVTAFPAYACDSEPFMLALRQTSAGEAARAIEVASGATLGADDSCPLDATSAPDLATATLLATVRTTTKRAAVIRDAGSKLLVVTPAPGLDVLESAITTGSHAIQFPGIAPPPHHDRVEDWLATLRRTTAVLRVGTTWRALVETRDGRLLVLDNSPRPASSLPEELWLDPPTIAANGVTVRIPERGPHAPARSVVVPLGK